MLGYRTGWSIIVNAAEWLNAQHRSSQRNHEALGAILNIVGGPACPDPISNGDGRHDDRVSLRKKPGTQRGTRTDQPQGHGARRCIKDQPSIDPRRLSGYQLSGNDIGCRPP